VGQRPCGEYEPTHHEQVSVLRGDEIAGVLKQHFAGVVQSFRRKSSNVSGMVSCFGAGVSV